MKSVGIRKICGLVHQACLLTIYTIATFTVILSGPVHMPPIYTNYSSYKIHVQDQLPPLITQLQLHLCLRNSIPCLFMTLMYTNYAPSSINTHTFQTVDLSPSMEFFRFILKYIYTTQDTAITFTLPNATPHIVNSLSDKEVPYSGILIFTLPEYHPSVTSSKEWGSA